MNILLAVRAVGALALPAMAGAGFMDRRRNRDASEAGAEDVPSDRPRPRRRDLQRLGQSLDGLADFDLRGADLRGLPLLDADLSGLDLRRVRLRRTVLRRARLEGARLDYADLSSADLRDVDLAGASLFETDLCGADLRGADLRGAHQLEMANVRNVRSDRTTRWPAGFVPVSDAARHP